MYGTQPPSLLLRVRGIPEILNGPWHERALWIYMVVVLAHWVEHLLQAYQIFILNWARPDAKGALGLWNPWLVSSEILHFGYALFMVVGLLLLRSGFQGRSRFWWDLALLIQTWHFVEHSLLQVQALTGQYLFGASAPISILQLWVPRPELHLFYNAAVFIPMVIGMYYHLYPPPGEPEADCGCSRTHTLVSPGAAR
jgi:hypothetical protein